MSHSFYSRPLHPLVKLGLVFLIIATPIFVFLLYRSKLRRNSLPPFNSQLSSSPSPDPTSTWEYYSYSGLELKHPPEWKDLVGKCQALYITKSDAVELERPISEYITANFFGGDASLYENSSRTIVETAGNYGDLSLNFPHIPATNLAILGPLGEGELNNVIIRGPEGTGYYHISVRYSGPIPDKKKLCLEDKKYEYKGILSTLKFSSSGARLNENCSGVNNITCDTGLVCSLKNPAQPTQGGVCTSVVPLP